MTFAGASATKLTGAAETATALIQTIFAAGACGVARRCTENAAAYQRTQTIRPADRSPCFKRSNITAPTWPSPPKWRPRQRGAKPRRGRTDQMSKHGSPGAVAGTLAGPLRTCAPISTPRSTVASLIPSNTMLTSARRHTAPGHPPWRPAAETLVELTRAGCPVQSGCVASRGGDHSRNHPVEFVDSLKDCPPPKRPNSSYRLAGMPHWPKPYGRAAGAVEQLVIEEEFKKASLHRPAYGITGWILTIIQHGTADQVERWVETALRQDVLWCQLFSEPDAGPARPQ